MIENLRALYLKMAQRESATRKRREALTGTLITEDVLLKEQQEFLGELLDDLRDILGSDEGEEMARGTGRTECSVCGAHGLPWEFDDSGRCADCAP